VHNPTISSVTVSEATSYIYKAGDLARQDDRAATPKTISRMHAWSSRMIAFATSSTPSGTGEDHARRTRWNPRETHTDHDEYKRHTAKLDADELSIQSIYDWRSDLRLKGILNGDERNGGRSGGLPLSTASVTAKTLSAKSSARSRASNPLST